MRLPKQVLSTQDSKPFKRIVAFTWEHCGCTKTIDEISEHAVKATPKYGG